MLKDVELRSPGSELEEFPIWEWRGLLVPTDGYQSYLLRLRYFPRTCWYWGEQLPARSAILLRRVLWMGLCSEWTKDAYLTDPELISLCHYETPPNVLCDALLDSTQVTPEAKEIIARIDWAGSWSY